MSDEWAGEWVKVQATRRKRYLAVCRAGRRPARYHSTKPVLPGGQSYQALPVPRPGAALLGGRCHAAGGCFPALLRLLDVIGGLTQPSPEGRHGGAGLPPLVRHSQAASTRPYRRQSRTPHQQRLEAARRFFFEPSLSIQIAKPPQQTRPLFSPGSGEQDKKKIGPSDMEALRRIPTTPAKLGRLQGKVCAGGGTGRAQGAPKANGLRSSGLGS